MAQTAAMIGGGVIGGEWAARFLLMGWDVQVFDPDPDTQHKVAQIVASARRSLPGLSDVAMPAEGQLTFHATMSAAVKGAVWIQESVPERLALKRKIYQTVQEHCAPEAVIASSTRVFKPSELQGCATRPAQIIVAHPFNPVYLLPLVELVPSDANPSEFVDRAADILTDIGMHPLRIGAEIDAHIADRLRQAIVREALGLVNDGIATTAEIDDAIRYGFGLRWAQMGLFETCRIADQPAAQSGVLDRIRDDNLVTLLRGLKARDWGAGALLNAHDRRVEGAVALPDDLTQPIPTMARAVPLDWSDYNGHMTEARYLHAFGEATDRMMLLIGCDAGYIAAGRSFFTAETHIRHLDEAHAGTVIRIDTQVLAGAGKKMHLFHRMWADDRLLATGEHMLIHVSLGTRRACDPEPALAALLERIAAAHADLPRDGAGKAVGGKG